eukprot:SAG31_NODE_25946_length_451_cov_0.769886_1_plen_63_part_01
MHLNLATAVLVRRRETAAARMCTRSYLVVIFKTYGRSKYPLDLGSNFMDRVRRVREIASDTCM